VKVEETKFEAEPTFYIPILCSTKFLYKEILQVCRRSMGTSNQFSIDHQTLNQGGYTGARRSDVSTKIHRKEEKNFFL
jgi:hypothetical protein